MQLLFGLKNHLIFILKKVHKIKYEEMEKINKNSFPTWKSTYLETKLDEIKVESVLELVTNNYILVLGRMNFYFLFFHFLTFK